MVDIKRSQSGSRASLLSLRLKLLGPDTELNAGEGYFRKKDTVLRVSQKSLIAENTRLILMDKKERNESGSKRAAIEGTNSALKRAHGAGKLRVRGLVRCSLVMGLKTIAHNFHQIVRFFQGDTRQNYRKNADIRQGILATI